MGIVSITLAALLATGAQTGQDASKSPTVAPSPTPEAGGGSGKAASEKRYCVVDNDTTGTRISRKTCRTRAEWVQRGFDPLAPQQ